MEYVSIKEAARRMDIAYSGFYKRVKSGKFPSTKIGGLDFINVKDIPVKLDRIGNKKPAKGVRIIW
jgi:hypothetical protein